MAPNSFAHRISAWLATCLLCAATLGPTARAWDAQRSLAAAQRLGPKAVAGVRDLHALLAMAPDFDDAGRLAALNQFFNRRIVFADDAQTWNQLDHWASPLELLAKGAGDCEDYVIAKYFSLLASGVPGSRLRLVYVRLQIGGPKGVVQPHMVLAYHATPSAEPLILDNLIDDIRPASRRLDLVPVFSFNGESLWQGIEAAPVADSITRLSRWRGVVAKAKSEGFQ